MRHKEQQNICCHSLRPLDVDIVSRQDDLIKRWIKERPQSVFKSCWIIQAYISLCVYPLNLSFIFYKMEANWDFIHLKHIVVLSLFLFNKASGAIAPICFTMQGQVYPLY